MQRQPTEKLPDKFTVTAASQHVQSALQHAQTTSQRHPVSFPFLCKHGIGIDIDIGIGKGKPLSIGYIASAHSTSTGMGFTDGEQIMRKKKQPHVFRFSSVF
jgi:hypothetical protein